MGKHIVGISEIPPGNSSKNLGKTKGAKNKSRANVQKNPDERKRRKTKRKSGEMKRREMKENMT